ncbi:unnamed protein product [Staurois parvus]|uniref:Uncharacterized protein n=1 Tax=Staurois parvus TaxID=386267 RepID=A0ABN9FJJ6_9NEOB|nr:unnamed protein product [Staurois parvus]
MKGHYSSPLGHQCWGTIPPTDTNDGALFLPLTPMMGHYSSSPNSKDWPQSSPLKV